MNDARSGWEALVALMTLSLALGGMWRLGALLMEVIWDEVVVRLSQRWVRWRRRVR